MGLLNYLRRFSALNKQVSRRRRREAQAIWRNIELMEPRQLLSATVSVGDVTVGLLAGTAGFTLTRTGDSIPALDVAYTIQSGTAFDGSNYTSSGLGNTLHFDSGQTTAQIAVPIRDNNFAEASRQFTVDLTSVTMTSGAPSNFAAQQTLATGDRPSDVLSVDLNGDGKIDLVTADRYAGTVSVLFNTTAPGATTPSFATKVSFSVDAGPAGLAAADINGDGLTDLIVADPSSGDISVLLNTTALGATIPSFAAPQVFYFSNSGVIRTGNFDNDGKIDLVLDLTSNPNSLLILRNTTATGDTTVSFDTPIVTTGLPLAGRIAVADVNGDGLSDLIVNDDGYNSVEVLTNITIPGDSAITFDPTTSFYSVGSNPSDIAMADINGDGKVDMIVTNAGDSNVTVLLNDRDPESSVPSFAYSASQTADTGNGPQRVTVSDVNGDGKPDLLIVRSGDNAVSVLINTTSGGASSPSFNPYQSYSTGSSPSALTVADFNLDGVPDIAVSNADDATVSILFNLTPVGITPDYAAPLIFGGAGTITIGNFISADLNGDGKLDLINVTRTSSTFTVQMNTTPAGSSTLSFASLQSFSLPGSANYALAVGDINNDGKADILVSNIVSGGGQVTIRLNTTPLGSTTASFDVNQSFSFSGISPISTTIVDINGDGLPDVLNGGNNGASVLINTATPGSMTESFSFTKIGTTISHAATGKATAGDLNGDGKPDVLFDDGSHLSILINTTTPGSTTPSFVAQQALTTDHPINPVVMDMNNDGLPDIVVSRGGNLIIYLNTMAPGATTLSFAAPQVFDGGPGSVNGFAVADMNGDGKPDLTSGVTDADGSAASQVVPQLLNTTTPGSLTLSFTSQQIPNLGEHGYNIVVGDMNGDGQPDIAVSTSDIRILLATPALIGSTPGTATIISAPLINSINPTDDTFNADAIVHFTLNFSKAVTGVVSSNFTLSGEAASFPGVSIGTPTTADGGVTWTVPVNALGAVGFLGLDFTNRTGIADSIGNVLHNFTSGDSNNFILTSSTTRYYHYAPSTTVATNLLTTTASGINATLTATITSAYGTATATVNFLDGTTTLGSASVFGGVVTFTMYNLAPGSHSISAVYSGDATLFTSTGITSFTLYNTTTSLAFDNPIVAIAQAVTLSATVASVGGPTPQGTISFYDGSLIGTAALVGGVATFSTTFPSAAAHYIYAFFDGAPLSDNAYAKSNSALGTLLVTTNNPTATLLSSDASAGSLPALSLITYTAHVSAASGTPTGSVTFFSNDVINLGTVSLSAGVATLSVSSLGAGTDSITAIYQPDSDSATYDGSTSYPLTQIITKLTSTTTITAVAPPIGALTKPLTLSVSTSGSGPSAPQGRIDFYDTFTNSIIGSSTVVPGGITTFTTSSLALGSHIIVALYSGSAYYLPSNTGYTTTVRIQSKAVTSLTLSSNTSTPVPIGTQVTLTATASTAYATPTGVINFFDNGSVLLGSAPLVNGVAAFNTSAILGGTNTITATYAGDAASASTTSAPLSQVTIKKTSVTTLVPSSSLGILGETMVFIATVTIPSGTGGFPTPEGRVDFFDTAKGRIVGSDTLDDDGHATYLSANLEVGSHTVIAYYGGEASYGASNSGYSTVVSIKQQATAVLSLGAYNITYGQTFSITSTVHATYGSPTGAVSLYDGTTLLATGYVQANGTTTFGRPRFSIGTHSLTIVYAGDSGYAPITSAPAIVTVS